MGIFNCAGSNWRGPEFDRLSLVASPGALLQVQVMDPEHLLPAVASVKGASLLEPQLQMTIRGSDRIVHHYPLRFSD